MNEYDFIRYLQCKIGVYMCSPFVILFFPCKTKNTDHMCTHACIYVYVILLHMWEVNGMRMIDKQYSHTHSISFIEQPSGAVLHFANDSHNNNNIDINTELCVVHSHADRKWGWAQTTNIRDIEKMGCNAYVYGCHYYIVLFCLYLSALGTCVYFHYYAYSVFQCMWVCIDDGNGVCSGSRNGSKLHGKKCPVKHANANTHIHILIYI